MDPPLETLTPAPLYEALTSYPLSPLTATPPLSPAPASASSPLEPYTVFRNEISLSFDNGPVAASSSGPDFFSLDLGDDGAEPKTPLLPPSPPKKRKYRKAEPELVLESSWFKGNGRFKSPMLQLHKEMVDFCAFLSPTPEEEASRNEALKSVTDVIKFIWPHSKVEVFGSFRTGLYLPTSDIDIVILGSGVMEPKKGLQALSKMLSRKGIAKKIQVIAHARVPIIKFVEKTSNIAFDLSFDLENGPSAADFIKDVVSRLPPLRPLCLILKVFLQQRELNEVYTGGLGSYALLTMIMAMFKSLEGILASAEQNLGVLLVNFFDFYGRKLNINDVGISCREAGVFFRKSNKGFMNLMRPSLIAIEDPQTPENDIGKNSYNYFQIRSAFAMAFSTLTNPKNIRSIGPNRSILGTIIRSDAALLARNGGGGSTTSGVTFDSLLPGAGEPLESRFGKRSDISGNWKLDDAEEEDLPRGGTESSSGKKRAHPDQNGHVRSDSKRGKTSRGEKLFKKKR